jgi:hypothetical protein
LPPLNRIVIPPPKRYCIVDAASGEVSKVMDELDVKCVDELDAKCVGEPVAVRERNIDSRYRFRDLAIAIESVIALSPRSDRPARGDSPRSDRWRRW